MGFWVLVMMVTFVVFSCMSVIAFFLEAPLLATIIAIIFGISCYKVFKENPTEEYEVNSDERIVRKAG